MDMVPETFSWRGTYERWSYDDLVAHLQVHSIRPLSADEKNKASVIQKLVDYGIPPEGEDDGRAG